jgi:DnaJ-class molecular chaperone
VIALAGLFLLAGGGGGWYVYTGYISPARTCKKCNGLGFRQLIGRAYTECRKCDGYGWTFRPAARHVRRRRDQASKGVQVRRRAQVQARQARQPERPVAR